MNVHSMHVLWLDEQPEAKLTLGPATNGLCLKVTCQSTGYMIYFSSAQLRTLRDACIEMLAELGTEKAAS